MITQVRSHTKTVVDIETNLDLARAEVAQFEHQLNHAVTPETIAKFGSDIRFHILRADFPHHGNIVRLEYTSSYAPTMGELKQLISCIPE